MVRRSTPSEAARTYARLLVELHGHIARGQGDSLEAEAVCEKMDIPGRALSKEEQDRVGGLAEDLYALAEGGPKGTAMSQAERKEWGQRFRSAWDSLNWDEVLLLLRHPPVDATPGAIPFLQARCWESLGDAEVAGVFLREAERVAQSCLTDTVAPASIG